MTFSPTGSSESLETMTALLYDAEWSASTSADSFRAALLARLGSPAEHERWIALRSVPACITDPKDRAAVLAERMDVEEQPVLLALILNVLSNSVPEDLIDPILASASLKRKGGPAIPDLVFEDKAQQHDLMSVWVTAHLNCCLHGKTTHATSLVEEWFRRPDKHRDFFVASVSSLRGLFSFDAEEPLRSAAFDLVRAASDRLGPRLGKAPADPEVHLAVDELVQELYFASGAYDGGKKVRPSGLQQAEWFKEGMPLLEQLTPAEMAHTCYQLLEVFEYFIDVDPSRVFRAVAATVKSGSPFTTESLGVDTAVRIVEKYLADYRDLFAMDPDLLSQLGHILEAFARVGWPAALHLSYSLGDIFR